MSRATQQQSAWSSGKYGQVVKDAVTLCGFDKLCMSLGVTEKSKYLKTPDLVAYVQKNFQERYCPEFMMSALGLKFTNPQLLDDNTKPTSLTTIVPFDELQEVEEANAQNAAA